MLEALSAGGTRGLKEFASGTSSTQMEPEQRAGSWQRGINNSLERVEGNRVSGQKVKSVKRLWSDRKAARPEAMSSSPSTTPLRRGHHWCLGRDCTQCPQGLEQSERGPPLPALVKGVVSGLYPAHWHQSSVKYWVPRGAFVLLLPVQRRVHNVFTETRNCGFYTNIVPILGFLSFYVWCLPLLRLEVPYLHENGFISGIIRCV